MPAEPTLFKDLKSDDEYNSAEDSDFDSDDSDDTDEGEEDKDSDDWTHVSDATEVNEEDFTVEELMASTNSKRKTKGKGIVKSMTETMAKMSVKEKEVDKYANFNMTLNAPFMVKEFLFNKNHIVHVDILVPNFEPDSFLPEVSENGNKLLIRFSVPRFFTEDNRVRREHAGQRGVQNNTMRNAHFEVVQDCRKHNLGKPIITGSPQVILLPFQCEVGNVQKTIQHWNAHHITIGGVQIATYHTVLRVELVGTRKMIQETVVAQQDYFGDAFEIVDSDDEGGDGDGERMGEEL